MSATILFPILIILAALIMAVLKIGDEAWSGKHWVILIAALIVCVASLFSFFALRQTDAALQKAQARAAQLEQKQDGHWETMTRLLQRPGLAPDSAIENRINRLVGDQTVSEKQRGELRAALEKARSATQTTMANNVIIASIETQAGNVNGRLAAFDSSMQAANESVDTRLADLSEQLDHMSRQLQDLEKRLSKTTTDSLRVSRDYLARLILKLKYLEEH